MYGVILSEAFWVHIFVVKEVGQEKRLPSRSVGEGWWFEVLGPDFPPIVSGEDIEYKEIWSFMSVGAQRDLEPFGDAATTSMLRGWGTRTRFLSLVGAGSWLELLGRSEPSA